MRISTVRFSCKTLRNNELDPQGCSIVGVFYAPDVFFKIMSHFIVVEGLYSEAASRYTAKSG